MSTMVRKCDDKFKGSENSSQNASWSPNSTNLLNLPDEILLKILESLPLTYIRAVRRTCTRLCNLSHFNEIMEKQIFIMQDQYEVELLLNIIIEMDIPHLNLEFSKISTFTDTFTKFLYSYGFKINSLTFNECTIPFPTIEDIMLSCVWLKELRFHRTKISELSEKTRIKPEDTNKMLEFSELIDCEHFSDYLLNIFLDFYVEIKSFKINPDRLRYIKKPPFDNYEEPRDDILSTRFAVHKINTCNKPMECLDLCISDIDELTPKLYSEMKLQKLCLTKLYSRPGFELVASITRNNLKELKIVSPRDFNLEYLQSLLIHCIKLERLSLNDLPGHPSFQNLMEMISKYGKCLKVLEYSNHRVHCFYNNLNNVDLKFSNLQHVELHRFTMNDKSSFKFLINCRLTHLILSYEPDFATDDLLHAISATQITLIVLKLKFIMEDYYRYYKGSIRTSDCSNFYSNFDLNFPKLEVLEILISGCASHKNAETISSNFTHPILNNFDFPVLKKLQIHFGFFVEKKHVRMMINRCPLLENLNYYCMTLEKITLEELCNGLKFLRTLEVNEVEVFDYWNTSILEKLPENICHIVIWQDSLQIFALVSRLRRCSYQRISEKLSVE